MIPVLFFFGVCFFGIGDCDQDEASDSLNELRLTLLDLQLQYKYLTSNDYVGNGCLQRTIENPYTTPDNPEGYPNNWGIIIASQSGDGSIFRHNLNGTEYTETLCNKLIYDIFEGDKNYENLNYDLGEIYYDGEWLRNNVTIEPLIEQGTMIVHPELPDCDRLIQVSDQLIKELGYGWEINKKECLDALNNSKVITN